MHETLIERMTKTEEGNRLFERERAILDATEVISALMQQKGVSRSELARRLGKSKSYVTRLLGGNANMTVGTLSDVFVALGSTIRFRATCSRNTAANLRDDNAIWAEVCRWSLPETDCRPADESADLAV